MPRWETNSCNNFCVFKVLAENNHKSGFENLSAFTHRKNYLAAASRAEGRSHSQAFILEGEAGVFILSHKPSAITPCSFCFHVLCSRKPLHRNIVTYPCSVERIHLPLYLVHSDPFCLSLDGMRAHPQLSIPYSWCSGWHLREETELDSPSPCS